jgi:hypothetical protein
VNHYRFFALQLFSFQVFVFANDSSLTGNDNFEFRHPVMLSCNYYVNKQSIQRNICILCNVTCLDDMSDLKTVVARKVS